MSRSLSTTFRSAIFSQRTEESFLFLMVISHSDITTIRVVNNYENITSGGNVYTAYPFTLTMPDEKEGVLPRIQVVIDNVDRLLVDEIRSLTGSPTISLSLVLGRLPDVIEWGPSEFKLRNVRYDAQTIKGDLKLPEISAEPYPGRSLTPNNAPGLFQ